MARLECVNVGLFELRMYRFFVFLHIGQIRILITFIDLIFAIMRRSARSASYRSQPGNMCARTVAHKSHPVNTISIVRMI